MATTTGFRSSVRSAADSLRITWASTSSAVSASSLPSVDACATGARNSDRRDGGRLSCRTRRNGPRAAGGSQLAGVVGVAGDDGGEAASSLRSLRVGCFCSCRRGRTRSRTMTAFPLTKKHTHEHGSPCTQTLLPATACSRVMLCRRSTRMDGFWAVGSTAAGGQVIAREGVCGLEV